MASQGKPSPPNARSCVTDDPLGVVFNDHVQAMSPSTSGAGSTEEIGTVESLSALYQVDCSPILDENDQPVALFQHPRVKIDVALDTTLLVGFGLSLYIASRPSRGKSGVDTPSTHLTLLTDGQEHLQEDFDEGITDVKWVDNERFAVSYSSGTLRIFNRDGKVQFGQKFHHAGIAKLDLSANISTKTNGRTVQEVDMQPVTDASSVGGELWILYEDATVAIVQVRELLLRIRAAVYGPAQANKFRKYVLRDQHQVVSAVPCGPAKPSIFQSHHRVGVHTVVSVGTGPFLSFYHAGNDQNSIIHLAHIATVIASRAAGAVWSFAKSWGWSSGAGNSSDGSQGDATVSGEMRAVDAAAEHVAASLESTRSLSEDPRRKCRTLVLSPVGRLAAISDTLGRILLVDTSRMTVIRMWKGYRYAQCGWMHGDEGKGRFRGLYLVIYSAQRGIVEVWRTRYGPRVFSFAVGDSARLFTHYNPEQNRVRCLVLSGGSSDGMTELIEVKSNAPSALVLMKYFTQNKLQEENFVLHQIIGNIQAFAKKKRADSSHTLEQDSIDPLLHDIASLASPTSIQALMDSLLTVDMSVLSPSFVLKVFEHLHASLRNGLAARSPTGVELSLLWQLQWRQRLLSSYIGLHGEFNRARHILQSAITDTSVIAAKLETQDDDTKSARSRLALWLELYRRSGFNWSEHDNSAYRQSCANAAELTWWEFSEFFSMPFTDPDLPRRRDVVALYEHTERSEDFLRRAFDILNVPVLRANIRASQMATLRAFLFTPVLSNVFAVQELQLLHKSLFLLPSAHSELFIEWYFSLPIGSVLAIPPPSLSCAFQRWLTPYIGQVDSEQELEQGEQGPNPDPVNKRRLAACSDPLLKIFAACVKSNSIVHAFVLSEQCRWGETESSKAAEESTMGRFSCVDGGLRWSILQDCLAKTFHVGIRLGRLGKLSVETLESVDDILRSIALMQLNDGHDLEDDNTVTTKCHDENGLMIEGDIPEKSVDSWVAELEDCRNANQMRSWQKVLQFFPQFRDKNTLFCFRVSLLCAAWNAERSDMRQLEDAVNELQAISLSRLRAAMGIHVWERYIRVHVVTLISFWEESAAGRTPQRGLQPQIARRFFGIIKALLEVILASVVEAKGSSDLLSPVNQDDSSFSDDENEDDDEASDGEDKAAGFVVEHLTSRKRWSIPVRQLARAFVHKWPPSQSSSSFMQSLRAVCVDRVSVDQLKDHLSLVLLLDSFAATPVTPVSVVKLFPAKGRWLCRPDSFLEEQDRTAPICNGSQSDKESLNRERTSFLRHLLHHNDSLGYALAEAFDLPTEVIREEYVIYLYQSGKDELADFSLDKVKRPERLIPQLGSIARARLSLILKRMKAEPEFAMVMSILPADLFVWITTERLPPFVADPLVEKLDKAPSLTGTSMILLRCLTLMPPTGPEFDKISAMSVMTKDIIARVKHHQGIANVT